jgi:hypothetical protein
LKPLILYRIRKIFIPVLIFLSLLVISIICLWIVIAQPMWSGKAAVSNQVSSVDPERLKVHVRKLSEDFFPRNAENIKNLDQVAAYIRSEFELAKGQVWEQEFKVGRETYRNVIANFGPETSERIVVGAHYDAVGLSPGADDNASAVAGLIELAYLLGNTTLPLRVELVAYTLEEPPYFASPFMGSAVHAKSLSEQGIKVRLMLGLEMIGYFSDKKGSQHFPSPLLRLFYPSTGNFVALVGKLDQRSAVMEVKRAMSGVTPLPVYSINAPRIIPGVDLSDHRSYWAQGYPAVMVTDTAFYRNLNYHTADDTYEKLDFERMAMVVEMVYASITAIADKE